MPTIFDMHNTLTAGFVVLAAQAIQTRHPNKSWEECESEAFFQIVAVRKRL